MKKLQTITLKGKKYVQVNVRIQEFRNNELYKGWSLDSEILTQTERMVTIKATIRNHDGVLIASGHATEFGSSDNPKITENCETSAWGRALGNLGIGVDESIARLEEMKSFHGTNTQFKKQQDGEDATCPRCRQAATKLNGKYGPYIKCLSCQKNFTLNSWERVEGTLVAENDNVFL